MNANEQSNNRTPSGDTVRPEVRPNVSFWELREVKQSRIGLWAKSLTSVLLIRSIITAMVIVVGMFWRMDGVDVGHKLAFGVIVILALTILGLAHQFMEAKSHATTSQDDFNESSDA